MTLITLENSIFEFVKDSNSKNKNVNSSDIVVQFRNRTDNHNIILKTIAKLLEAGKIKRKFLGFKYGYVAVEVQDVQDVLDQDIQKQDVQAQLPIAVG